MTNLRTGRTEVGETGTDPVTDPAIGMVAGTGMVLAAGTGTVPVDGTGTARVTGMDPVVGMVPAVGRTGRAREAVDHRIIVRRVIIVRNRRDITRVTQLPQSDTTPPARSTSYSVQ